MDKDPAGEIGERDVGARRTQVGHEQVARVGAETKQARGAAARGDPNAGIREQAAVDQQSTRWVRTERPSAVRLGELCARALAVRADVIQDVDQPGRRRTGSVFSPCPC